MTGSEDVDWPRSAYDGMRLPADYIEVPEASHWGLVFNRRVVPGMADWVTDWLDASVS